MYLYLKKYFYMSYTDMSHRGTMNRVFAKCTIPLRLHPRPRDNHSKNQVLKADPASKSPLSLLDVWRHLAATRATGTSGLVHRPRPLCSDSNANNNNSSSVQPVLAVFKELWKNSVQLLRVTHKSHIT